MKKARCSKTIWASVLLPVIGWGLQYWNGGILPMLVQTWGPLLVAVGYILLRCATTDACVRERSR